MDVGTITVGVPLAAAAVLKLRDMLRAGELHELEAWLQKLDATQLQFSVLDAAVAAAALAALVLLYRALFAPAKRTYLLDFAMADAPPEWTFPRDVFLQASACNPDFTADDMDFQTKIVQRSGLGDATKCPPWLHGHPFFFDMAHARLEFEVTCYPAVEELLGRTGVSPKQIRAVIVNSSLFNPTPSLSAMIMNRFRMPSSTINYNLGGMGCSASLIAIDLARKVLNDNPNSYVLVVSHENITNNWYPGQDRSMLVPNCIFRANGAAMLLTNKRSEARRSKYVLQHLVRVNMAGTDKGYTCVYQTEDDNGDIGVRLSKDLTSVAAQALMANLGRLGPKILPLREKLLYAAHMVRGKLLAKKSSGSGSGSQQQQQPYVPNFKAAVAHVCIHSGGRAVIDGMQKVLKMTDEETEPSRATLYKWGNVSSSSVWYVLSFIESFRGVRKGDKVWQLSFGSGFKCNSAIWVANRRVDFMHPCWASFDIGGMRAELAALNATLAEERAARKAALAAAGAANGDTAVKA